MEWLALALLAVAVVTVTVLVATGRLEPALLSEPTSTVPPLEIPDEPTSTDVDRLRLGTSVYGYAVTDVDAALDARRDRLADQERALAGRSTSRSQPPEDRDGHVHPDA